MQAVLSFNVAEDAWNDGALLKMWFSFKSANDEVSPYTKFARACALALNRPIRPDDDLDPASVFVGKKFEVEVGFSSRDTDGNVSEANRAQRKFDGDFPRIHELIRLVL